MSISASTLAKLSVEEDIAILEASVVLNNSTNQVFHEVDTVVKAAESDLLCVTTNNINDIFSTLLCSITENKMEFTSSSESDAVDVPQVFESSRRKLQNAESSCVELDNKPNDEAGSKTTSTKSESSEESITLHPITEDEAKERTLGANTIPEADCDEEKQYSANSPSCDLPDDITKAHPLDKNMNHLMPEMQLPSCEHKSGQKGQKPEMNYQSPNITEATTGAAKLQYTWTPENHILFHQNESDIYYTVKNDGRKRSSLSILHEVYNDLQASDTSPMLKKRKIKQEYVSYQPGMWQEASGMEEKLARQHFLNTLGTSDKSDGITIVLDTVKPPSPYKYPIIKPTYRGSKEPLKFGNDKPLISLTLSVNTKKDNEYPVDDYIELSDTLLTHELNEEYKKIIQDDDFFCSPNRAIHIVERNLCTDDVGPPLGNLLEDSSPTSFTTNLDVSGTTETLENDLQDDVQSLEHKKILPPHQEQFQLANLSSTDSRKTETREVPISNKIVSLLSKSSTDLLGITKNAECEELSSLKSDVILNKDNTCNLNSFVSMYRCKTTKENNTFNKQSASCITDTKGYLSISQSETDENLLCDKFSSFSTLTSSPLSSISKGCIDVHNVMSKSALETDDINTENAVFDTELIESKNDRLTPNGILHNNWFLDASNVDTSNKLEHQQCFRIEVKTSTGFNACNSPPQVVHTIATELSSNTEPIPEDSVLKHPGVTNIPCTAKANIILKEQGTPKSNRRNERNTVALGGTEKSDINNYNRLTDKQLSIPLTCGSENCEKSMCSYRQNVNTCEHYRDNSSYCNETFPICNANIVSDADIKNNVTKIIKENVLSKSDVIYVIDSDDEVSVESISFMKAEKTCKDVTTENYAEARCSTNSDSQTFIKDISHQNRVFNDLNTAELAIINENSSDIITISSSDVSEISHCSIVTSNGDLKAEDFEDINITQLYAADDNTAVIVTNISSFTNIHSSVYEGTTSSNSMNTSKAISSGTDTKEIVNSSRKNTASTNNNDMLQEITVECHQDNIVKSPENASRLEAANANSIDKIAMPLTSTDAGSIIIANCKSTRVHVGKSAVSNCGDSVSICSSHITPTDSHNNVLKSSLCDGKSEHVIEISVCDMSVNQQSESNINTSNIPEINASGYSAPTESTINSGQTIEKTEIAQTSKSKVEFKFELQDDQLPLQTSSNTFFFNFSNTKLPSPHSTASQTPPVTKSVNVNTTELSLETNSTEILKDSKTNTCTLTQKLELPHISSEIGGQRGLFKTKPTCFDFSIYDIDFNDLNAISFCDNIPTSATTSTNNKNCTVTRGEYEKSRTTFNNCTEQSKSSRNLNNLGGTRNTLTGKCLTSTAPPVNSSQSSLITLLPESTTSKFKPSDAKAKDFTSTEKSSTISKTTANKRPASDSNTDNQSNKRYKSSQNAAACSRKNLPSTSSCSRTRETSYIKDPRWALYNFSRPEDCFEVVRNQWCCSYLPNPHEDLTRRFTEKRYPFSSNFVIPGNNSSSTVECLTVYSDQMNMVKFEMDTLKHDLDSYGTTWERRKIRRVIDRLNRLRDIYACLQKAEQEAYHFYKYYQDPQTGWNAWYMSNYKKNEVTHQLLILDSYETFYGYC